MKHFIRKYLILLLFQTSTVPFVNLVFISGQSRTHPRALRSNQFCKWVIDWSISCRGITFSVVAKLKPGHGSCFSTSSESSVLMRELMSSSVPLGFPYKCRPEHWNSRLGSMVCDHSPLSLRSCTRPCVQEQPGRSSGTTCLFMYRVSVQNWLSVS